MKPKLIQSRVCLAGRLNVKSKLNPENLDSEHWERIKMTKDKYNDNISHYYPSLVRSMLEVDDEEPQVVCRYEMKIKSTDYLMKLGQDFYPCKINNIRLWFFPYDIVLFSIDINECPKDLSDLPKMHFLWKDWKKNYEEFQTKALGELLEPLTHLIDGAPDEIPYLGTKMRQFQVIETETLNDELLYEIGSFTDIGVVGNKDPKTSFKPSEKYFTQIINENTLSVFSNWKALALNDSFTVLCIDDFYLKNEFDEDFELLYMRALLEEFYCFNRNNQYREDSKIDSEKIEREIAYMEQHYFFEDMSYDFLPPLVYRTMAKGLELQKDREQLIQHVKESLRERRRERQNYAIYFVQIFAAVSVIWTIHEIVCSIWPCIEGPCLASVFAILALVITIILLYWPSLLTNLLKLKV